MIIDDDKYDEYDKYNKTEYSNKSESELIELETKDDVLFFPELLGHYSWLHGDHIFNEMKLDKTDKCLIVDDDDRCMNLLNTIFKIYNTNSGVIVINIGFNCHCSDWDNNKYKRFLEYIDKNISCKFSFVNNEASYEGRSWWIYMNGYIHFTINDYGQWHSCNKVKVTDIIFDRLKKIHECWSDLKNHKG